MKETDPILVRIVFWGVVMGVLGSLVLWTLANVVPVVR